MLRPQKMSRIIIAGIKSELESTIQTLYRLNVFHIEDYHQKDEGFKLGKPLVSGAKISEDLVKIRSISKNLDIDKDAEIPAKISRFSFSSISQKLPQEILPLQTRILNLVERINAIERRKTERENTRDLLTQLSAFPLPLELYAGYDNLEVFVGTLKFDPTNEINRITREYELFKKPGERGDILIALFVSKKHSKRVFEHLNSRGFSPIDVPHMSGDVREKLAKLKTEIVNLESDLNKYRANLEEIKEINKDAILAGEEYLSNEVEKTDAPLRFASSKNAFIAEGWIPMSRLELAKLHLSSAIPKGVYIEVIEEREVMREDEEEKEPPIQLENPKGAKPYEYLIELFSLPSYKEFDPTMVLYLIFPIFFGFMIGDAGYGIALIILAWIMIKVFPSDDAKNIAKIVAVGGLFAIVFGLFIFADAFGVPFHDHGEGPYWEAMLGIEIPFHAAILKLDSEGVIEMLVLSIFAAFVHLGLGFLIGISNEVSHNNKHAIAKAGWFLVLTALFMLMMNMAQNTKAGGFIGDYLLGNIHIPAMDISGLPLPYSSAALLAVGIVLLVVFEGPMAIMEILGLVGNMVSYTRLAAIGVAKGAVAVAFNTMLLPLFEGGNYGMIGVGILLLFICHMLVIILGAISSGIQAVRLNYVEFFLKFYKGGGAKFVPFGATRKFTI